MSEFKGPWAWDDNVWEDYDPSQRAPWLIDAEGNPILRGEIHCVGEEFAKLISAAPDLLEALQLCCEHCRLYHREIDHNNVGVTVRAALAKAGAKP